MSSPSGGSPTDANCATLGEGVGESSAHAAPQPSLHFVDFDPSACAITETRAHLSLPVSPPVHKLAVLRTVLNTVKDVRLHRLLASAGECLEARVAAAKEALGVHYHSFLLRAAQDTMRHAGFCKTSLTTGCSFPSCSEWKRYLLRRGLRVLLHSRRCPKIRRGGLCSTRAGRPSTTCQAAAAAIPHTSKCTSPSCKVLACSTQRQAITHYRSCLSTPLHLSCDICFPQASSPVASSSDETHELSSSIDAACETGFVASESHGPAPHVTAAERAASAGIAEVLLALADSDASSTEGGDSRGPSPGPRSPGPTHAASSGSAPTISIPHSRATDTADPARHPVAGPPRDVSGEAKNEGERARMDAHVSVGVCSIGSVDHRARRKRRASEISPTESGAMIRVPSPVTPVGSAVPADSAAPATPVTPAIPFTPIGHSGASYAVPPEVGTSQYTWASAPMEMPVVPPALASAQGPKVCPVPGGWSVQLFVPHRAASPSPSGSSASKRMRA